MYIPKEVKVKIRYEQRWDHVAQKYVITNESEPGPHLGYATYVDEKGKLRKETSWNGWGNKHLGDFANGPKRGFKLEKAISRSRDWFGSGRTMFRMIHPDNFIFEISANNLNEIILSCNLNKGEIDDECVLAWDGLNLALIPCSTDEYLEHSKTTKKIENGTLKSKDLIIGNAYQDRNAKYIGHYVGRFYSLSTEFIEYDINGRNVKEKLYGRNPVHCTEVIFKIKQDYYFKRMDVNGSNYYQTWANPKLYTCDKPNINFGVGFIPQREYYYSPIIPDDIIKRKDKDEIVKWAQDNKIITRSLFGVDYIKKFEVDL